MLKRSGCKWLEGSNLQKSDSGSLNMFIEKQKQLRQEAECTGKDSDRFVVLCCISPETDLAVFTFKLKLISYNGCPVSSFHRTQAFHSCIPDLIPGVTISDGSGHQVCCSHFSPSLLIHVHILVSSTIQTTHCHERLSIQISTPV